MNKLFANLVLSILVVSCQFTTPPSETATGEKGNPQTKAPVVNAGPDQSVIDLDGNGSQEVILNGYVLNPLAKINLYRVMSNGQSLSSGNSQNIFKQTLSLKTGIHTLTFEATNSLNLKGSDTVVVQVKAAAIIPTPPPITTPITNTAPMVQGGEDFTVSDSDLNGFEKIRLKALASDTQNNIISYLVSENGTKIAEGNLPSVLTQEISLSVGAHTLTLEVRDAGGLSATDSVVVSVVRPAVVIPPPVTKPGFCANHGSRCQFSGIWTIRYGAGRFWSRKTFSPDSNGGVMCDDSIFGDPIIGTLKTCELFSAGSAPNTAPQINAGADVTLTDADKSGSESVTLVGSASDAENNISLYRLLLNGSELAAGSASSILTRSVSFPIGTHTLMMEVYDVDGLKGSDSLVVIVSQGQSTAEEDDVNLTPYITQYKGAIKNPYYSVREWPVLSVDQSSNHHYFFQVWDSANSKVVERRYDATPESQRLYPVPLGSYNPQAHRANYTRFIRQGEGAIESSGSWDDVYKSLDDNHSALYGGWSENYKYDGVNTGNTASPATDQMFKLQFEKVGYISTELGSPNNFTSMSYSGFGHGITNSAQLDSDTERNYLYRSWIRATPGHLSYVDTHAEEAADNYIGLFAHSFQSLGRSGSEVGALTKMIMAGSYLDRDLKDLLKVHGHYGAQLLSLFRQSLPYADDQGGELPPENELFHRPVYSSSGNDISPEYVDSNYGYHGYNDGLHVYRMAHKASHMSTPAPLVVANARNVRIFSGSDLEEDVHVNDWGYFGSNEATISGTKLVTTVVAKDFRRIEVLVDLKDSIDLLGRTLTFSLKPIYFNQSHVIDIEKLATNHALNPGQSAHFYRLSFNYDQRLPRTRMSVGIFASNGVHKSLPAFINVIFLGNSMVKDTNSFNAYYYPPAMDNSFVPWGNTSDASAAKNRNKRPVITAKNGLRVNVAKNQEFRLPLTCTDPEGFPTRIYKWLHQIGRYDQTSQELVFTANELASDRLESIHIICSDGTAGYSAETVKLAVGSAVDETRGAIYCSGDQSNCQLPDTGRYQVFYGRLENPHYPYLSKIVSGVSSVACKEDTFGNPGTWVGNFCYYKPVQ